MSVPPARIYTLPLFPLNHVLFPQFLLQMQIFEERYLAMIGSCIDRNEPFGVVLIQEGEEVGEPAVPHSVGCVVQIQNVEHLEDGRLQLVAAANGRFRILDYMEGELPYLVGRVEDVEDLPETREGLEEQVAELTILFRRYLGLLADRARLVQPDLELPTDPSLLSFCVAYIIQVPLIAHQHLLESTDARQRITDELDYLRDHVATLEAEREELEEEMRRATTFVPLEPAAERWKAYSAESRN
jgi:Lon protease-like protein